MEEQNNTRLQELELAFDYFQRTMIHHALWYLEVKKNLGVEKANLVASSAWKASFKNQFSRLAKVLGLEMDGDFPSFITNLEDDKVAKLKEAMAINWLANDGIWFQAVEFQEGMMMAKHCNDEAWRELSPFEAIRIKSILGLGEHPGLDGLKQALQLRMYAEINKQSIANETENSFDFFMNECRVQVARKRKGLDDYPCKSAGIIEYSTFAATIDSRIKTTVIGCPPDKHPEDWYCGWRFFIED